MRVDFTYEAVQPKLDQRIKGVHRYLPEFRGADIGVLPSDLVEDNYLAIIADGLLSLPYRAVGWLVYALKAGSLDFLDRKEDHTGNRGFCMWNKRPYKGLLSSVPILRFKWYKLGNALQRLLPFKRILLPGISWVSYEEIELSAG
ncbi:MAG: hypothetical protein PHS44_00650 [Candidatus Dojkabacteria bacterium]|nr:hypothetical protein [Candidatus Dojkabacteria bacterium]